MKNNPKLFRKTDAEYEIIATIDLIDRTAASIPVKTKRIQSIDLLRGTVMIIMALDHVRDYFHKDAFSFDPTDLSQTSVVLFFTRFITHYCAPVFVFLSGISACLYGAGKSKVELSHYLLTRGIWLVVVEIAIIDLVLTFNPSYPMINLQVIWAIGISMIALSAMIYLKRPLILTIAIILIAVHNLLDQVHAPGTGPVSFLWSLLHEPGDFIFQNTKIFVRYPVMPWIGVMALGYYLGNIFNSAYQPVKRRRILLSLGSIFIGLFFVLRSFNFYGDAAHWSVQNSITFSMLSVLNVTKYPPSLLYVLVTLGPAMIFLAYAEKPLDALTKRIIVFGRVPFFYYILHLLLIHLSAVVGAVILGYKWTDMSLSTRVNSEPRLQGYGFDLPTVYVVWVCLIFCLYPFCKWFEKYKRAHQAKKPWLTYI